MKWFGLTGGIATGKSSVAEYLRKQAVPVADADSIVHQLLSTPGPLVNEIVFAFGPGVLLPAGGVNRKALGKLVFAEPTKLMLLESLVHPNVKQKTRAIRDEWQKQGHKFAIYDVPLLFEKNMQSDFDGIICIASPVELQRERLKKRDQLSDVEIDQRLSAQLPITEKTHGADWVIDNTGTLEDLYRQVDSVLADLKS